MRSLSELVKAGIATVWATLLSLVPGRLLYNWGGTAEEMGARYKGDELMPDADLRLVRALTVDAPPEEVWPWVAQIGRGAGYYSYEVLDNGGKPSADHLLDVPPPALGDRNEVIGEVMHVEPGREIAWQITGVGFFGSAADMVLDYSVLPHGASASRAVLLLLARVRGRTAWLVKRMSEIMDHVMASEQLLGLKWRVEAYADRDEGEIHAPCAGAADHQRDAITYAGQADDRPSAS